jgi:hypothetical protein
MIKLRLTKLSITTISITYFAKMTLSMPAPRITTHSIITFSIRPNCDTPYNIHIYTEEHLFTVTFMLSVVMLSVVKLSVVASPNGLCLSHKGPIL